VAVRVSALSPGPASRVAAEQWASQRQRYLDNLKVLLIALIIVGHAIESYADLDWWSYGEVREVTLSPVTEVVLLVLAGPFAILMIPILFLIAGLLTQPSAQRKGAGAYAPDRLLRLGVPFAVFVLVLQPSAMYVMERNLAGYTGSFRASLLGQEQILDTGPLWFVGVLLIFSLGYAGRAWARRGRSRAGLDRAGRLRPGEIRLRHLVLLVAAVTVATFLVRLVFPFNSENKYLDLNLYQWPACLAMFALGIVAAKQGWLTAVPHRLRRQSGLTTLAALIAFGLYTAVGAIAGIAEATWGGGWNWYAFVFAALESALTVFGSVWLLAVAHRHLNRPLRWAGPAARRSGYGAFILQSVVLIGLAMAMRPLPLPAEVKAVLLAAAGLAGSFGIAWLLISRVPGIARIL
jgi:fucose 4-O-acetylase-like acetyltransferase